MSEEPRPEFKPNRRQFLRIAATTIALTPILTTASCAPENSANNEVEQKKKEVEQKYGIELRTLKDIYNEAKEKGYDVKYPLEDYPNDAPPESWDMGRLNDLDKYLGILPPHFYDAYQGTPLRIVLSNSSTVMSDYIRVPHPVLNRPNMIGLNARDFAPERPLFEMQVLTHELTHMVTMWKESNARGVDTNPANSKYFAGVDQIVSGYLNKNEEWYKEVKLKLHEFPSQYNDTHLSYLEDLLHQSQQEKKLTDEDIERIRFYTVFSRGVFEPSQRHFLTTLSELYIQGKPFFNRLNEFLPEETTNKLYDYTKTELFDNREYQRKGEKISIVTH